MVIDKVDGKEIPRYLVHDIICHNGDKVASFPFFPDRLSMISQYIMKPRIAAIENGLINKSAEPFSVRNKDFWDITQTSKLLGENFAASLSHESDGLVFQPSNDPYECGRSDQVLKWKPPELNSVDFRMEIPQHTDNV